MPKGRLSAGAFARSAHPAPSQPGYTRRLRKAVLLLALSLGACGAGADSWPDGRPRIDQLAFLEQTPQDPLTLVFTIRFTDTDGDLGRGKLHLLIDGEERSVLPLEDVFNNQIPALDTGAKEGAFEIHVSVSVEGGLDVGERLLIGFILEDAAGQRSNEPSMTLEAVKDLS